jgi:hypothetical protein
MDDGSVGVASMEWEFVFVGGGVIEPVAVMLAREVFVNDRKGVLVGGGVIVALSVSVNLLVTVFVNVDVVVFEW